MTRKEFLDGLRTALGNDLQGPVIRENVNYYNGYISDEVGKGRREEDVIAELGDPWVIARTLIDAGEGQSGAGYQGEYNYGAQQEVYGDDGERKVRVFGQTAWWKRLLFVLGVVGVLMLVTAVVGGIVSLLAPVVIPVIVLVFIVRLLRSRR